MNELTHPLQLLVSLVNDPEELNRLTERTRQLFRSDGRDQGVSHVWHALWIAGLGTPYAPTALAYLVRLTHGGWRTIYPPEHPNAGDLFFLSGERGGIESVGLVGKPVMPRADAPEAFIAVHCGQRFRRTVAGDAGWRRVALYLRAPG